MEEFDLPMEFITGDDPNLQCDSVLGGGGYAKVYSLRVTATRKRFARKVINLSGPITKEDIACEIKAINKLQTEAPALHIIRIFRHDWLRSSNRGGALLPVYYIDMELGQESLETHIKRSYSPPYGDLPTYRIWQIMQQIASGVKFIHDRGVIHRDLKPANVILSLEGIWKIVDFGISTMGHSKTLIATRDGRGTASYCAPEILVSEPLVPSYSNKVDIWGLGVILYELCTGTRAFANIGDVMRYSLKENSPPRVTTINYYQANDVGSRLKDHEIDMLRSMWDAACSIGAAFLELIPDPVFFTDTINLRLDDMNQHLAWLLQVDPTQRPSIEQVCLHMAANAIRKSLELGDDMSIYPHTVISNSIVTKELVLISGDYSSLTLMRWQFLIKLRAALGCLSFDILYPGLRTLALKFLIKDPNDPILNQNLLKIFQGDFQLCADFKKLYVYGHKLVDERNYDAVADFNAYQHLFEFGSSNRLRVNSEYVSCEADFLPKVGNEPNEPNILGYLLRPDIANILQ